MPELKDLTEKVQGAVDVLHKTADQMAAESKKFGEASGETKAQLEKINNRIDEIQLEQKRLTLVKPDPEGHSPEQKARISAFFKWMRVGKAQMAPDEQKALVEDATGLVLVPEDLDSEITRALPALTPMRGICATRTTTRDKIRRRSLTEVTMGWGKLETGTEVTESTLVPSDAYIYVEDLTGLTKLGVDELDDTDYNLIQHVASSFANKRAEYENTAFVAGTGHTYGQPAGIAVDTTLRTSLTSGCGANATGTYGISWATDDTPIFEDILECEYALPTQYLNGASWLMNRKDELKLRILRAGGYTASDGPWLWQPGLLAGQPNTIDGFPVYTASDMPYSALATAVTNVVFGNFKQGYLILDRSGMRIQRLDEKYAESGLVGFLATFRVGGGLLRRDTFQIIVNDV